MQLPEHLTCDHPENHTTGLSAAKRSTLLLERMAGALSGPRPPKIPSCTEMWMEYTLARFSESKPVNLSPTRRPYTHTHTHTHT